MQTITGNINKALEYKAITQEKDATPTKEVQEITPDEGYDGISKMTIKKIPDEYIIPNLNKKTITKNGTYKASDDNLDGYNEVEVETTGVDIADYFDTTNSIYNEEGWKNSIKELPALTCYPNVKGLFSDFRGTKINVSNLNTSSSTDFSGMFCNNDNLETIVGNINMGNATTLDAQDNRLRDMFYNCYKLKNIGKLLNLGQAYSINKETNYSLYKLNLIYGKLLTHDSLINVINGLYDIATKGCNTQSVVLGSTNLAKLTSEEIAIATNKGWTVS